MAQPDTVLLGTKYQRLTLLAELPRKNTKRVFLCECDCGNRTEVLWQNLKRGASTSCGCYAKEVNTTHGDSRTSLYNSWHNMVARCTQTYRKDFIYYGGVGISVCDAWLDYDTFKDWALLNGHTNQLTIERRDVLGDYCPTNCYWADRNTQAANRSKRSGCTVPYIGVGKYGLRWAATICAYGVKTRIGVFDTPEQARDARNAYIKLNNLPHTLN